MDEHTAAVIDFGKGELSVLGAGGVTLSGAEDTFFGVGERTDLDTVFRLLKSDPLLPPAKHHAPVHNLAEALSARSAEAIAGTLPAVESRAAGGSEPARALLRAVILEVSELAASGLVTRPSGWEAMWSCW